MNDACYCDYDPPIFSSHKTYTARKSHRCSECGGTILPGEKYDYMAADWSDGLEQYKTCKRCSSIKSYVTEMVPCFCWYYGTMRQDALDTINEYAHELPGLFFGYGRLEIAVRRHKQLHPWKQQ